MEEFKKVFEEMAVKYAEHVKKKIEDSQAESTTNDGTNDTAITLMNEVRTVNVVAVTLTRMNAKVNEERPLYSDH